MRVRFGREQDRLGELGLGDVALFQAYPRLGSRLTILIVHCLAAPFAGLVAERLVSLGDYVTKGMKVAIVVRVNPLRLQVTVPEQFVSAVKVGAPVTFQVDAYPGREFSGTVRFVSPALLAELFPGIAFTAKPPFVPALELFVADPAKTAAFLAGAGVPHRMAPDGAVEVPPQEAAGVLLRFRR